MCYLISCNTLRILTRMYDQSECMINQRLIWCCLESSELCYEVLECVKTKRAQSWSHHVFTESILTACRVWDLTRCWLHVKLLNVRKLASTNISIHGDLDSPLISAEWSKRDFTQHGIWFFQFTSSHTLYGIGGFLKEIHNHRGMSWLGSFFFCFLW